MKVWLPYVRGGSGTDVFTETLATGLREQGVEAVTSPFAHNYQYAPWLLRRRPPPPGTDIVVTNTWNGFAFKRPGIPMVTVEHHCIFDPAYLPYRSRPQAVFHETLVRRFELATFAAADAVISVSRYTADSLRAALGIETTEVIHNGIDVDFFTPGKEPAVRRDGKIKLLFVGNPSRRKGADLLPPLMARLGEDYELTYTSGLRASDALSRLPNTRPLGRLSLDDLRQAYREADMLVFPSRLEGFGYAAAEAMACGTPVITTESSALPEVVTDGETGILCPVDDRDAFERAVRALGSDPELRQRMGRRARDDAAKRFALGLMVQRYRVRLRVLLGRDQATEPLPH
jgi:glycosyltransferase involved in cell wall biosynthesis